MLSAQAMIDQLHADLDADQLMLPTLPDVALKVRDAVEDENASLADVSRIVANDAALSARLLQVANSPLYRGNKTIDSLQMAVSRLGQTQVRNLVTSLVMQQMFHTTQPQVAIRLRRVWEHSTRVAALCHVLAGRTRQLQTDQALLAGLIHDIGALPILVRAENHPEMLENEGTLDQVVAQLHTEIGARILERWGFPAALVEAASQHEQMQRHVEQADYTDLVTVANIESHRNDAGHPLSQVSRAQVSAYARLGLDPDADLIQSDEEQQKLNAALELFR